MISSAIRRGTRALLTFVTFLILFLTLYSAEAQTKRAFIVGIDLYNPESAQTPTSGEVPTTATATAVKSTVSKTVAAAPNKPKGRGAGAWVNLDGAVNDAAMMRDVLIARYGFDSTNIVFLRNQEASREAILSGFRKHLIEPGKEGDIAFFFYAGHGSQVRNSLSKEADKKDETLVPADSYTGAADVRDKELRALFNQLLDKKPIFTAIFDCCHSGSVSRGLLSPGKTRFMMPDETDVQDAAELGAAPAKRGALVISSALDEQVAGEQSDEKNISHGAFSLALFKTLASAAPNESAERIFLSAKAMMQAQGRLQEPTLEGTDERRRAPLFGGTGIVANTVAVLRKEGETVVLQAGYAAGLNAGCELRKYGKGADTTLRLRITQVDGVSRSQATLIGGDLSKINSGDLFELDMWVAPSEAALRVWIPSSLPKAELERAVKEMRVLQQSPLVRWVENPAAEKTLSMLFWETDGWKLSQPDEASGAARMALGKTLSAKAVLEKLSRSSPAPLFAYLPPVKEIKLSVGQGESAIAAAQTPNQATYLLAGRLTSTGIEYAWILPNATDDAARIASPLPLRTDWIGTADLKVTSDSLEMLATRIAKLKAWLTLDSPPDDGAFPYSFALKNATTGVVKTVGDSVRDKETYGFVLRADEAALRNGCEKRYVYVFIIDSGGNCQLLYPIGRSESRIPFETAGQENLPTELALGAKKAVAISPPFGVDTYIMLTTKESIPNPEQLTSPGVLTRGAKGKSPLSNLLFNVGAKTRGANPPAPTDWSIERITLRSIGK